VLLGIIVGTAVAFFLWSLDHVTQLQWRHGWLLFLLPLAGLLSGGIYHRWGQVAEGGTSVIVQQIRNPSSGVPAMMAPLVLVGTLITHLFGGSAGREGTAVQMGGSLASWLGGWLRISGLELSVLLRCGMAAGFGAVFGTPLASVLFALDVVSVRGMSSLWVLPILVSALTADQIATLWQIHHTAYHLIWMLPSEDGVTQLQMPAMELGLWLKVAVAALVMGLVGRAFILALVAVKALMARWIARSWLRPVAGGCLVIGLFGLVGSRDYLGLGVSPPPGDPLAVCIESCFREGGAQWYHWAGKLVFTALTVGSGFKGGEVTPLFFIGAALGKALAVFLAAPVNLLASVGFAAVFAAASKTPLASTVMAIELFAISCPGWLSSGFWVYAATACFLASFSSGKNSIYGRGR
jgi:H+/Cl- antiporter ClcA